MKKSKNFLLGAGIFISGWIIAMVTNGIDYKCHYTPENTKKVVINVKDIDLKFESLDWDDGEYMYSSYNFDNFFDVIIENDCLYIKNKENVDISKSDAKNRELDFYLPIYFDNHLDFDVNVKNGNVKFSRITNMDNISCNVEGGNITGCVLIADKINLSVDNKHNISVIRIIENPENKSVPRYKLIRIL